MVIAIAVGVAGVGVLAQLQWETAFGFGQLLIAAGFLLGMPTGALYHVLLARALRRRAALPRGWYWQPIRLHGALLPDERIWVLFWCGAGATGFLLIVLGLLVVGVPLVAAILRG
ncbi:MAG: hypothetical protein L0Y66_12495 [Myxococcaceae bacterium]|nr:hypothetical protein [Myxococcaceae bacterium]MCI0669642.1 hypothetical protein [Myxococcaceae bacterium]